MPTLALLLILSLVVALTLYHRFKPVPFRIHGELRHYRVPSHMISFLWNLTWYEEEVRHTEQNIFTEAVAMVNNAEQRIIIDIFLMNEIVPQGSSFQPTTGLLVQAWLQKKLHSPEIESMLVTDPINTFYGMDYCQPIDQLQKAGVLVIITDINKLRDNNLLYSGLWRLFFGWQKPGYFKIIPHPLRPHRLTSIRALLKAMNARGNHRKVIVCDDKVLITSSNFDNKSAYFCDVGLKVADRKVADYFAFTEYETARMSGHAMKNESILPKETGEGDTEITPLLGSFIRKEILHDIDSTGEGDEIFIGMLFISHRKVIHHLLRAVKRGVHVRIVADRNDLSFGKKKRGLPNRATLRELAKNNMEVRFFSNRHEEFHTKLVYIRKADRGILHLGSANFTRRSLLGTNLESNIRAEARRDAAFLQDTEAYIRRIVAEPYSEPYMHTSPNPHFFWYYFTRFLERTGGATF